MQSCFVEFFYILLSDASMPSIVWESEAFWREEEEEDEGVLQARLSVVDANKGSRRLIVSDVLVATASVRLMFYH